MRRGRRCSRRAASPGTSRSAAPSPARRCTPSTTSNFVIGQREIVALVGESGSGKSTIARLLARVYTPTAGEIFYQGRPLSEHALAPRHAWPTAATSRWSSRTRSARSTPHTASSHGILRGLELHRPDLPARSAGAEAERLVGAVGLAPARRRARPLPLRAQRRPAAADRLRPGAGLPAEADPGRRAGVDARRLDPDRPAQPHGRRCATTQGVSLLYITHDIASARYVADRVMVMYAGHIVESGPSRTCSGVRSTPTRSSCWRPCPIRGRRCRSAPATDRGEPPRVIDPTPGLPVPVALPVRRSTSARP